MTLATSKLNISLKKWTVLNTAPYKLTSSRTLTQITFKVFELIFAADLTHTVVQRPNLECKKQVGLATYLLICQFISVGNLTLAKIRY